MSHDHCVTIAAIGGILAGFLASWPARSVWGRIRWYVGPCVCTREKPGYIHVGDGAHPENWRWEPCPFCVRGERIERGRAT